VLRNPFAGKNFPVATYTLIALNTILWVGMLGSDTKDVYSQYALIPANAGILQMFTACFLHGSLPHLLLNMFLLWLFGRRVERTLGSVEFFIFYIGSGFAASVMHLAIVFAFMPPEAKYVPAMGASGAIAGVLGVYAIRFYRDKFTMGFVRLPASMLLLGWLIVEVVLGMTSLYISQIDLGLFKLELGSLGYWAHLGGFIFGMGFAQISQLGLDAHKEYLLTDAQDSYRRGTLLDVARDYEDLVQFDPDDPFAYAELGRTWAMLGDPEESIPFYEKAMRLYLNEQRTDLAVERFRELRESFPGALLDSKLHFRMGCLLEDMGAYEEAIEVLNHLAKHPSGGAEAEMAALRVGEIHLTRLNRPDFAIAAFNRFLKNWPDSEWRTFAEQALARARERS